VVDAKDAAPDHHLKDMKLLELLGLMEQADAADMLFRQAK